MIGIVGRAEKKDDANTAPLMNEVCLYALHHALLALERALWLRRCASQAVAVEGSAEPAAIADGRAPPCGLHDAAQKSAARCTPHIKTGKAQTRAV